MKKNLALASLMLVGTLASAMDVNYFVAVGSGKGYQTIKWNEGSVSGTIDRNGAAVVLDGGVLLDNTHRIGLEYAKYNTDSGSSMYSVGLGYEYLIDLGSKFKPFVGASYNIVKYSEDTPNEAGDVYDSSSFDLTTNALMARIGAQYDFNNNFYVSGSYDYALTTSGDSSFGFTNGGTHYTINVETDKLSKFQFLVGYKF